jgi:2-keto-4-pentenoate hydratase/2-oxohepta-3-ene-1,7-dioic acid hydratase in catechol pathway
MTASTHPSPGRHTLPVASPGLALAGLLALAACGSESPPSEPPTRSVSVAALDEALTFARADLDGDIRLLAVREAQLDAVLAVDLTAALEGAPRDPIELLETLDALDYDEIVALIQAGEQEHAVRVRLDDLTLPVELTGQHVAAGTNFADHAEEATVEDGPFLFAKLVQPTPFRSSVAAGDALLDYEVELAFVCLQPTPLDQPLRRMGLILANDFTDRAALLRLVDPSDVTSGKGFTTGKSKPGYLPVGNLFVVPRDLRSFVSGIELRLWVGDELRQSAPMSYAIWDLDEILAQTSLASDRTWDHLGSPVRLPLDDSVLPARTLLLAGTPGGTVFAGVPKRTMVAGASRWLAGGWGQPLTARVVESYIKSQRKARSYLQPGDRVIIAVDRLGLIETTITQ